MAAPLYIGALTEELIVVTVVGVGVGVGLQLEGSRLLE